MKSQLLIVACLCLVVGLPVVPAHAQAGGVQARVPFSFAVLGKTLPAGDYMMIANLHKLTIEDAHARIVAVVLVNNVSGRSAGENGQIIFHCYGDRCFLAEVWSPAQEDGRALLTSQAEADLAKEQAQKYFAVLGEGPVKRH